MFNIFSKKKILNRKNKIKILILGLTKTGKSTYIYQNLHNIFLNSYSETIGSAIYEKKDIEYNNNIVDIEFIEIGGKERYEFLIPWHSPKCQYCLLFYKKNDYKSKEYIDYLIPNIDKKCKCLFIENFNDDEYLKNHFENNQYVFKINTKTKSNLDSVLDFILIDV